MQRLMKSVTLVAISLLLAFLLGWFCTPGFGTRWRNIKDRMTREEVRKVLGTPTWTGTSGVIGDGNQPVTRWEYKRDFCTYYVDFDYIGPDGAPLVFRTERLQKDWESLWWRLWRGRVRY